MIWRFTITWPHQCILPIQTLIMHFYDVWWPWPLVCHGAICCCGLNTILRFKSQLSSAVQKHIFTLWVLEWFFKTSTREEAKSHWLHLYDFSPEWVFKCTLKLLAQTKTELHWLYLKDLSPEWLFKCALNLLAAMVVYSHWLHLIVFFIFLSALLLLRVREGEVSILMANCWLANFVSLFFGYLRLISLLLFSKSFLS